MSILSLLLFIHILLLMYLYHMYLYEFFQIRAILQETKYSGWFSELYRNPVHTLVASIPMYFNPNNFKLKLRGVEKSTYVLHFRRHSRYVKAFWILLLLPLVFILKRL